MSVQFNQQTFPYCCGVEMLGNFANRDRAGYGDTRPTGSGSGYYIGTFTNTPACQAAYGRLSDIRDVVCQTPPRRNRNSGNDVFIAIFGPKKRKSRAAGLPAVEVAVNPFAGWPLPVQRRGESLPR